MEPATPVKPMGKFRASYLLAVGSFELFRKDKEIAWYMVLNTLGVLAVGAVFTAIGVALMLSGTLVFPEGDAPMSFELQVFGYGVLFLFYLVTVFITTYFGVALTHVVAGRINGEDRTYADGINAASARISKIFAWSMLSSTVGVALQLIADKAGWAGRIFSFLGGVAWSVATFFMIPVITLEENKVGDSVKRSSQVFVATWGETVIVNFSLGLFFLGFYVVILIAGITLAMMVIENLLLAGVVMVLALVAIIVTTIMQAVLEAIVRVTLYHYAVHGKVAETFTPELIMGALRKKEPKQASI